MGRGKVEHDRTLSGTFFSFPLAMELINLANPNGVSGR